MLFRGFLHKFLPILCALLTSTTIDIIKPHIFTESSNVHIVYMTTKKKTIVDTIDDKHIYKYGIEQKKENRRKKKKQVFSPSHWKDWNVYVFSFADFGYVHIGDTAHVKRHVVIAKPHTIQTRRRYEFFFLRLSWILIYTCFFLLSYFDFSVYFAAIEIARGKDLIGFCFVWVRSPIFFLFYFSLSLSILISCLLVGVGFSIDLNSPCVWYDTFYLKLFGGLNRYTFFFSLR